ncbi:C-type lectin Cal-like [Heterodontus francisci]|uniref:C-type lectin Cal-like n=1 Tax=Heterodontus francisci TaxID=7792 RepID=UPI00355BEB00
MDKDPLALEQSSSPEQTLFEERLFTADMMLVMALVLSALLVNEVAENKKVGTETDKDLDLNQAFEKRTILEKGPCAADWFYFPYLSSCYNVFSIEKTWIEAELHCQASGGHLASIHWEEQNKFIRQVAAAKNQQNNFIWVGLSDIHKVRTFLWTDGSTYDFRNWDENQPDDYQGNEKCVHMNHG